METKNIILIAIAVLVIALIAVAAFVYVSDSSNVDITKNATNNTNKTVIDVDKAGNNTTVVGDNSKLNGTNNTHPIYFDLYMQDTNELLYSSPVLPVGADLTNCKLDIVRPAGSYQPLCISALRRDAY